MTKTYKCPNCGYSETLNDEETIITCPTCKHLANFSEDMRKCCPVCRSVLFKKWDKENKPCPKCSAKMQEINQD